MMTEGAGVGGDEVKRHFRRGTWVAIGVGFALLVLAALCAIAVSIFEDRTSHVGRRSREIREAQTALVRAVDDAEISRRGYLLTGDESYLAPFKLKSVQIPVLQAKLQTMAVGAGVQRRRLDNIRALAGEKLSEMTKSIALRRAGAPDAAVALLKSSHARGVRQHLRQESDAFDRLEERVADNRRMSMSAQRRTLIWIMIAALIIAATLAAVVALEARRYALELTTQNTALKREAAQRARAEGQLRQSQKMEAVGQLTGGVAHDFNNMLAIVIGNLDMMLRRLPPDNDRIRALAEHALSGANKAANLTKRLLAFSRQQPLNPRPTDVNTCVKDMSELLLRTLTEEVMIETVLDADLWRASIDASQLESAILNLAVNARDAMPSGGRLTVKTANVSLDNACGDSHGVEPGQYVLVSVTDTGAGMTPTVLEKAFEPFFTTKAVGEGSGLGLSQVHGFISQSRGHVRISTELGVGTSVKLYLPRDHTDSLDMGDTHTSRPSSDNSHHTVLIVEDDSEVRAFATSAARELGFRVLEADGASSALDILTREAAVSILLTDVVMPKMTGRELAERALRQRPCLPVVFMTGYTRDAIVHNGELDRGTRLLTKPFTLSDLDRELNAALACA